MSSSKRLVWAIAIVASMCLDAQVTGRAAQQDGRSIPHSPFTPPTRRMPDAPPPPPPALPAAAEGLRPLTLEVVTRQQPAGGREQLLRQTVTRTRDRIHMTLGDSEWLFERNAIDPRRVSGLLIVHAKRTIVLHEESDLRNRLGVNGWTGVLMLGLDPAALAQLKPTGQTRTMNGIRFVKHAPQQNGSAVSEVWWSEGQALPAAFMLRHPGGSTRVAVERLHAVVDTDLLRNPSLRFPGYKMVDLAEWLEGR